MIRAAAIAALLSLISSTSVARPPAKKAWCTGPAAKTSVSRLVAPCVRKTVGFYDLPAELARIEGNCRGIAACPQYLQEIEVKDIAVPQMATHLWTGQIGQSFDMFQQDGFIADAKAKAQSARPAAKNLVAIEYLYFYPLCGSSTAFLGARATYAGCGPASFVD